MNSAQILTILKNELTLFLDELIDMFPEESDFVIFRFFLKDKIPILDIMRYIDENLIPLQDKVKARDESFFLTENIQLFKGTDVDEVDRFKRIWTSDRLDDDDRAILWTWFDHIICVANKWKHVKN